MSGVLLFFDRSGRPIDLMEWAALRSDEAVCNVAQDYLVDGDEIVRVSTVWLGIDMSITGRCHIFETMVFGGRHDEWTDRYSTEAAAFAGHDQALAMVVDKEGAK